MICVLAMYISGKTLQSIDKCSTLDPRLQTEHVSDKDMVVGELEAEVMEMDDTLDCEQCGNSGEHTSACLCNHHPPRKLRAWGRF